MIYINPGFQLLSMTDGGRNDLRPGRVIQFPPDISILEPPSEGHSIIQVEPGRWQVTEFKTGYSPAEKAGSTDPFIGSRTVHDLR